MTLAYVVPLATGVSTMLDPLGYAALGSIYDAAMDTARWREALDAVTFATDGRVAALMIVEREDHPYSLTAVSGQYEVLAGRDNLEYYTKHLAHLEKREWESLARQPVRQPLLDSEAWADAEILDQRADYRFLREKAGIRRRLGVRLNENAAWYDAMTIGYDAGIGQVPRQHITKLMLLLPHLAKAVEMGCTFMQLRARYAAVLSVLDHVHVGLAIARASGDVIVTNAEADRILSLGDGIVLSSDNRFLCRNPDQTELLRTNIVEAALTAAGEADRPESLVAVARPSGAHPFLIEVAPVCDAKGELDRNLAAAFITLIDPNSAPRLKIDRFAALFGLTGAEAAVCTHMVNGLTGPLIAEIRGTSPETVKVQMAAVLAKTGTRRRSELIRLVVRTLPPIA